MRTAVDSQQLLAQSIVRAVQLGMPVPELQAEISKAVEQALLNEARTSERTLARARVAATLTIIFFSILVYLNPALAGLPDYPFAMSVAPIAWLFVGLYFMRQLDRGYYHRHLRRTVPLADALGICTVFLIAHYSLREYGGAPPGIIVGAATFCGLIAFSGSLRLSRSSARFTTGVALVAAVGISIVGGLRALEVMFIFAAILATGLLSGRLTGVIRRLITNEVARAQLAQLYTDAREAADAREEVLKIVSHDLRNPLNTIGMAADMMLEVPDAAQRQRSVGIIKRTSERMNRMIQDLLDVAKLEAGRIAIDTSKVSVRALMEEATDALEPLARKQGIKFETKLDGDLPDVLIDTGRTLQVFSNLVGNALKFTPKGGSITIRAAAETGAVKFSVIDTGSGIPVEHISRIFGRFWQAKQSDRRGLGLGLTIAKSIVEAHGGRIGCESTFGHGTEFWFTVPVAPADDPAR